MATPTTLPASFTAGAVLEAAQLNNLRGAFRVLQVVSTTKTDTFSTTSTTMTDLTGLSLSITPSATSSKVLLIANFQARTNNNAVALAQFVRDSTAIGIGDAAGSRTRATSGMYTFNLSSFVMPMQFLDSPNTTSATTYKVQMMTSAGTATVSDTGDGSDAAANGRLVATITAMEISA